MPETIVVTKADVGTLDAMMAARPGTKPVANPTRPIFCAQCQVETAHAMTVAKNPAGQQELVATCSCGRALKTPADLSKDEVLAHFAAHKSANLGQVPAEAEFIGADHPLLKALAE